MSKHISSTQLYLLKTEKGYLHDDIDEGMYLAEGELNYSFTDDPLAAFDFPNDDFIPKYLDNLADKRFANTADCCEFLDGVMVHVVVTRTIEWKEVYKAQAGETVRLTKPYKFTSGNGNVLRTIPAGNLFVVLSRNAEDDGVSLEEPIAIDTPFGRIMERLHLKDDEYTITNLTRRS